jgi:hypothetical protein
MTAAIAARGAEENKAREADAAESIAITIGETPIAQCTDARKAKRQRGAHYAGGAGRNR